MSSLPTILLVGTADTKSDELAYLRQCVQAQGAQVLLMDVGVLDTGQLVVEMANTEVAAAAGSTLQALRNSGDENSAMTLMAQGAAVLARRLHVQGRIHGLRPADCKVQTKGTGHHRCPFVFAASRGARPRKS